MIAVARVLLVAAEIQLRQLVVHPFLVFNALLAPLFFAVMALYMLRGRPEFDPVYVVVGAGLTGTWSVVLFSGSSGVAQERGQGTLELLEAAPPSLLLIIGGKMLGTLAFSLLSMVVSYVVAAWLFGETIVVREPLAFAVSLVFALTSFWSMGMLFSPLAVLWPVVQRYLNGIEYPVYVFGGFLAPVALLPIWLIPVSYLLPPYWAATALHGSSEGTLDMPQLAVTWAVLLATSVAITAVGAALFGKILRRARADGTLSFS